MKGRGDTIAAIATARGVGALSVVRLSGPKALAIAGSITSSDVAGMQPYTVRPVYLKAGGETLDHAVLTYYRAPHSSTGEDVVEITTHGGDYAANAVLQALLGAGARYPEPGEFTLRAFLNEKMDLTRAEAVADIIHAQSGAAHRVAVTQLKGRYAEHLEAVRQDLLDACALLELALDFSDEDVPVADPADLMKRIAAARHTVEELRQSYRSGDVVRHGIRVVIAGLPNAGKSTLFNALLGYERAIVNATPGTTRDVLEADIELEGIRYRFADTAGMRLTADEVEAEGVRRTIHASTEADLILYVFDATLGFTPADEAAVGELRTAAGNVPLIRIANKADLASAGSETADVRISARAACGEAKQLEPLLHRVSSAVVDTTGIQDGSRVVTNLRHRVHLNAVAEFLNHAGATLTESGSYEVTAQDLRAALYELGQITGAVTNEDVLDRIFSRFCIGK